MSYSQLLHFSFSLTKTQKLAFYQEVASLVSFTAHSYTLLFAYTFTVQLGFFTILHNIEASDTLRPAEKCVIKHNLY